MSETEQSILEAAKKIFIKKGFAAARMQEIADEAKINKALLHYYFRSKDKLFRVIVSDTIQMIFPRLVQAISYQGSVLEKLDQIVETYIDMIEAHPHMPSFLMMELTHSRDDFITEMKKNAANFPDFQGFFIQIMEEVQAGKIRPIHPAHLLLNTISLCVFPFMVKPIFTTVVEVPEQMYENLIKERKAEIKSFIRHSLQV